jgi:L-2-amino-thiazoline-4-carboxylic acid hydrolase
MEQHDPVRSTGRRVFLARALCAAPLCLGCSKLLAAEQAGAQPKAPTSKFLADSGMTFREVYQFGYMGFISTMVALGQEIGREKLVDMLKTAASTAAAEGTRKVAPPPPKNTLAAFMADMTDPKTKRFWDHVLTRTTVEQSENTSEFRITECLWAQTFRDAKAADIGYACICHPDFAAASAFNPKMKLIRTKTLMQGNDCCNHRWVVEA